MYASQGHMKHNYTYTHTNKSHTVFTICHNEYWRVHIHTTSTQEMNVHNNYVQTYIYTRQVCMHNYDHMFKRQLQIICNMQYTQVTMLVYKSTIIAYALYDQ